MKKFARLALTAVMVAVLLAPALAADKDKKKKGKKGKRKARAVTVVRFPKTIKLTDEQSAQIAAINKEYAPKVMELRKKLNAVVTPEQRKRFNDARKAARKEGLKGKELRDALRKAYELSPEQRTALKALGAQMRKLTSEARGKATALLTAEQKSSLKKPRKPRKNKKKKDK